MRLFAETRIKVERMNCIEAEAYLNSLQMHKIKLGLDSMESFLAKVDRPDKTLQFVHVAGTNGKGSVSVNIVSILQAAGYTVGLFTSPHLSSVRERFRIGDGYISEEQFANQATRIRKVLGEEMITYFEFTTAIALLWFAESEVDLVVLETGLGGRLDATNIVWPLVSVITNVSMDHEAYLGNTLEAVAHEKAGIIKQGIPLVTGVAADVTRKVVTDRCKEVGAPLYIYGQDFSSKENSLTGWSWYSEAEIMERGAIEDLRCTIRGDYQRGNSSLAIAAVQLLSTQGFSVTGEQIKDGVQQVRWPGRLEYIEIDRTARSPSSEHSLKGSTLRYLLDGAHNLAGVESLARTLEQEYGFIRLIVIWGAMEDKDLQETLPMVGKLASMLILTRPQGERSADPSLLFGVLPDELQGICHLQADVSKALIWAEESAGEDDLIVVAGSLYLVGEVRSQLVGELVEQ